jgi:hypothetical protein
MSNILEANGIFHNMPKRFRGALRCSVKETNPNFLVTDGSYFISAYFTPESYKQFRKENASLRVTDLQDIMVQINQWTIELEYDPQNTCFTSYTGLEMKMIIHQMDLKKDFRVELKKYPTNLYRDDKMKTAINNFLARQQLSILRSKCIDHRASKINQLAQANSCFASCITNGASENKTADSSVLSLEVSASGPTFEKYAFMSKEKTKLFPVKDIIKEEQGKKGLLAMQMKQSQIDIEHRATYEDKDYIYIDS